MNYPTMFLQGTCFTVYPVDHADYLGGALVYVFGSRDRGANCRALYIGQTGDASRYFGASHPKWVSAAMLGMSEVAVHWLSDKQRRLNLETILRHQYRPPLNEQGNLNAMAAGMFGGRW